LGLLNVQTSDSTRGRLTGGINQSFLQLSRAGIWPCKRTKVIWMKRYSFSI